MTGVWNFLVSNQAALAGALYGLAVLGTHLPDNTLVYKFCRWFVNGKGSTPANPS